MGGTATMLAELQKAVGSDKLIVAKDSWAGGSEELVNTIFPLDTFCSCYRCDWTPTNDPAFRGTTYSKVCQTQIQTAIRLGSRGQVVLLHGEVNKKLVEQSDTDGLSSDFEFAL